jgi:hypothetical protein
VAGAICDGDGFAAEAVMVRAGLGAALPHRQDRGDVRAGPQLGHDEGVRVADDLLGGPLRQEQLYRRSGRQLPLEELADTGTRRGDHEQGCHGSAGGDD